MKEFDKNNVIELASYNAKIVVSEHTSKKGNKYFMAHVKFVDSNGEVHRLFEHFIREYDVVLMDEFSKL